LCRIPNKLCGTIHSRSKFIFLGGWLRKPRVEMYWNISRKIRELDLSKERDELNEKDS